VRKIVHVLCSAIQNVVHEVFNEVLCVFCD